MLTEYRNFVGQDVILRAGWQPALDGPSSKGKAGYQPAAGLPTCPTSS